MKLRYLAFLLAASAILLLASGASRERISLSPHPLSSSENTPSPIVPDSDQPNTMLSLETLPPETTEKPEPEINTITISFLGDCMLATYKGGRGAGSFNLYAETAEPSHFFAGVYDILSSDDFTVANCENVFTDQNLPETPKDYSPAYWYRSPKKNAAIFTAGSIDIISLANNHTNDYGKTGMADTISALEAENLTWGNTGNPVIIEKYGLKIAIMMVGMWGEYRTATLSNQIAALEKETDYQIIYYHGGTERKYKPDEWRVRASRKLVDNGADLVIGNHPHVLQPMETYNGADILYSLGNFIFGGSVKDDRFTVIYQKILTVCEGEIIAEDYRLIPVYEYEGAKNILWQPVPMTEGSDDYNSVIAFMHGKAETPRG